MYAASYEDFIALIHDSADINDLKHLRRNIINEIMQATAINNLKKAKGVDPSRETAPQGTGKGDLLQARNLKRYINQLTYAKAQCERRISYLSVNSRIAGQPNKSDGSVLQVGGPNEPLHGKNSLQNLPGRKILMFQVLLDSAFARRYFAIYLDEIGHGALLSFWTAVHELRHADKKLHYQLGMEIYHSYLISQPPPIKTDRITIKGVEAFLLGNRGPEVLYELSEEVERTLEDRHYTGFLVSSTYHAMLVQAQIQGVDFMSDCSEDIGSANMDVMGVDAAENVTLQLSDHSTYARNKLAHLQEKLTNKLLALQAIKQSVKADPKVILHLELEISKLRGDHKQLETHIERTALWIERIGEWRVHMQSVQLSEEKDSPNLVFLVHLSSEPICRPRTPDINGTKAASMRGGDTVGTSLHGWVVVRKLSQIADLHRKLCQIVPSVKSAELPTLPSKPLFSKTTEKAQLEKIRTTAQAYFNFIMEDERLSSSELLYAFLSPSPEHLKQLETQPKKSKFSFSTLFNRNEKAESDEEDIGSLIEGAGENIGDLSDSGKDMVVEPLFSFLEELCDLRGVGKWLRKTLISFVQITYGKNITRHVRETIWGLLSESMVLFYLQTMKDSLWPQSDLSQTPRHRCYEDIMKSRAEAKEQFMNNIPVLLCTLVGQQNARKGAIKFFTVLQHHALNKNLFYNMFEVLLKELFPELQEQIYKVTDEKA